MTKVLVRSTNQAEQFRGQRKAGMFKFAHFTKFCVGLHDIVGYHVAAYYRVKNFEFIH